MSKLSKLLKQVYLGGIIEEAVVDLDNYSVQAVDVTNSLFLKVKEDGCEEGIGQIGIGNLSLVCKYIDTFKGEVSLKKVGNRLVISSNGRGELKYLLTDPKFISTVVKEDNISALIDPCVIKVGLEKAVCSDFSTYYNLLKPKVVTLTFNSVNNMIKAESLIETDHQFSIDFGVAELISNDVKSFSVSISNSKHFNQILDSLEFEENPSILMAPEHPLLITQCENIWAMLPLAETRQSASQSASLFE